MVHSEYRSAVSGENLVFVAQANALRGAGFDVQEITRSSSSGEIGFGSLHHGFTVATGRGPSPLGAIEEFKPDIVHVHNLFPNWGSAWIRELQIPLVSTVHNFRPFCSAGTFNRDGQNCFQCVTEGSWKAVSFGCYRNSRAATLPLAFATRKPSQNPLLRASAKVVFLHSTTHEIYEQILGADIGRKASVIPNFSTLQLSDKSPRDVRPYWVFSGRLAPEKGIRELIHHWPVSERLVVAGDGPERAACEAAGDGKRVEFAGALGSKELVELVSGSLGMIIPSTCLEAGLPTTFLDALQLEVPIVAFAGNNAGQEVKSTGTGVSFDDFSQIRKSLIKARDLRKNIVESQRLVRGRYSVESWQRRISKLYSEVQSHGKIPR